MGGIGFITKGSEQPVWLNTITTSKDSSVQIFNIVLLNLGNDHYKTKITAPHYSTTFFRLNALDFSYRVFNRMINQALYNNFCLKQVTVSDSVFILMKFCMFMLFS